MNDGSWVFQIDSNTNLILRVLGDPIVVMEMCCKFRECVLEEIRGSSYGELGETEGVFNQRIFTVNVLEHRGLSYNFHLIDVKEQELSASVALQLLEDNWEEIIFRNVIEDFFKS
jgi:hypothetical protein